MRRRLVLLAIVLTGCVGVLGADEETDIHSTAWPEAQSTIYRGFTVHRLDEKTLSDALNDWHVNQVRFMICPIWRQQGLGAANLREAWDMLIADLPAGLDRAHQMGISVIVDLHQLPNDDAQTYTGTKEERSAAWWRDQSNLDTLLECWRELAEITAQRPEQNIWLEIYNEPLDWGYVHEHPSYPPIWPKWAQMAIDEIRQINTVHPIVIATGPGMLCWGFRDFPPLNDPYMDIIYSLHMWQPVEYTHQGINGNTVIPWMEDGPEYIAKELQPAVDFQKKHNVRMHVGEFGAPRWGPGAAQYLRECLDFFEEMGWDWNYHAFREAGVWSLEIGEAVDLLDTDGNYVKTGLAADNPDLRYRPYDQPMTGALEEPEGLTERGQVVLEYLKLNLEPTEVVTGD